nr:sugar phosphate nucleotidyltransferase [uncultured Cohaesibacter sp.]
MMQYKGIILAGGSGTRLSPLTDYTCKQLLAIYDKPLIYYPLTLMLLAKIREILIISTPQTVPILKNALGDGRQFGVKIDYAVQQEPNGIAECFLIAEDFLKSSPCMLILGDNIINMTHFTEFIDQAMQSNEGGTVFGFPVAHPQRFGVIELDKSSGQVLSIEEKPLKPKSNIASIGMYLYSNDVVERAKRLSPSSRGELEITDINRQYLLEDQLKCQLLTRGDFWADAGTFSDMNNCSNYIRLQQEYTSLMIGCPEEAAFNAGLITRKQLKALAGEMKENSYSNYLLATAEAK